MRIARKCLLLIFTLNLSRYQPTTIEKVEANIGYTIRKKMNVDEELYMDRDSQIEAIEKTFKDAEIPITEHYSKPHVHPVEVLPIMPDFHMWKYPCAQVIFDSDPAPAGVPQAQQMEQMGQAMIRGGRKSIVVMVVFYNTYCSDGRVWRAVRCLLPPYRGDHDQEG